jgi:hypothetical protein
VTLEIKIGCGKVKTGSFGSAKWFWPDISAEAEQILTPDREESVMNVITMLLPGSDSLIHNDWSRWVAISGLPPICTTPSFTLVLWVGLEKSK